MGMGAEQRRRGGGPTFQHAEVHGVVGPLGHTEHHLQPVLDLPFPFLAAREQLLWETKTARCSTKEVFTEITEFVKIHDVRGKNRCGQLGRDSHKGMQDKSELPL